MTQILIVEDNPMNMTLVETILDAHGFDYISAVDGESSVVLAGQHDIDLILMDLQMPGINGFEAMQQIRELEGYANKPIIAVTGNTTAADSTKAIEAGFDDFLAKPFRINDLIDIIRKFV